MHFALSDEQRALAAAMRKFCERECPPAAVRAAWSGSGRSTERWRALVELGVVGLTVPEAHGGAGLGALELVGVLEEAGRAALPEPLVETTAVGVPLLAAGAPTLAAEWLPRVAAGRAVVTFGLDGSVADAHWADLLLLVRDGAVYAVGRERVRTTALPSVDGARRLFRVEWEQGALVTDDPRALAAAFDHGALGAAAELCGLGRRMLDVTVEYAQLRRQFGRPIGSFQAVQHRLADALVALELARPLVHRAAWSTAREHAARAVHVSMAKAAASEAALATARAALQCHGAIGYSFEHDLHLWMKRAWALAAAWGSAAWHRARVADSILGGDHE
jgi:alkylation response protein AidB-like acyl-CoA dehydrogenase